MNKKMKTLFSITLVLIIIIGFIFINRNKNSKNISASLDDETYHYVISNVLETTKDEYIFETMMIHKDNSLIYMVESEEVCYIYKGLGEDREILSSDVRSPREDLNVKGFTMDDEGNIYVLYGVWRGKETMNIYNKNKELVKADIDMEGDLTEIKNMYYFNEKLYILDFDRNLQIHSTDGKLLKDDIYSGEIYGIDIDDTGKIYMIMPADGKQTLQKITKIDCISNEVIFDIKIPIPPQRVIKYSKTNDSIYTIDDKFIHQFDSEGNLVKKEVDLISDVSLSISIETNISKAPSLNALLHDNKQNFYILSSKGSGNVTNNIYMLTKTKGTKAPDTRQEIVLTAAYEQGFIVDAISLYNLQSEEYKIVLDAQYKTYGEFMKNVIEAGEKLAVRIMANDVGDIVATGGNGLVYYDLLRTDAFIDLSESIKNNKNYADLNKEVLKAITIDGKLRGLPLGIAYYRMIYNKELGDTLDLNLDLQNIKWSEILELAIKLDKENSNISVFNTIDASDIFVLLLQANMPDLIDLENKKVNLRQDWFIKLVSDFKIASKLDSFMHHTPYDHINLTGDDSIFYFENLRGEHRDDLFSIKNNVHEILQLPTFNGEKNRNTIAFPTIMYSISNNSKYKDAAWDFLSYLLEVETQSLLSLNAHPVNLKTEKEIQKYYEMDATVAKQVDEIMNRVDYLYDMSYYKQDIVLPMNKYFNDEISLDEAIDEAEHNIWLRLNE